MRLFLHTYKTGAISLNIRTMFCVGIATRIAEFENSSTYYRDTVIDILIFEIYITHRIKNSEKYW